MLPLENAAFPQCSEVIGLSTSVSTQHGCQPQSPQQKRCSVAERWGQCPLSYLVFLGAIVWLSFLLQEIPVPTSFAFMLVGPG